MTSLVAADPNATYCYPSSKRVAFHRLAAMPVLSSDPMVAPSFYCNLVAPMAVMTVCWPMAVTSHLSGRSVELVGMAVALCMAAVGAHSMDTFRNPTTDPFVLVLESFRHLSSASRLQDV